MGHGDPHVGGGLLGVHGVVRIAAGWREAGRAKKTLPGNALSGWCSICTFKWAK